MKKIMLILLSCQLIVGYAYGQLEGIFVETYYVSDANDATDTFGGGLPEGSTTYRIWVDMAEGARLIRVFGDENSALTFSSTEPFFNHEEDGRTFAYEISRTRLDEGTIPVDSWMTLGLVSRPFTSGAYIGIPKEKDTDGSIIGGENNDGGSAEIPGGLLTNEDEIAGTALTELDGYFLVEPLTNDLEDLGFVDPLTGEDSSIFGSNTVLDFSSTVVELKSETGVMGLIEVDNEVLIAQLTTKGEISFDLNLEIEFEEEGVVKRVKYVSSNENIQNEEVFSPLLSWPWECGCKDPNFLEARADFACEDNAQCLTPIVLGCMDSLACNFDPTANFNVEDLCCYVGYCNDRDISLACPELPTRRAANESDIRITPNPAFDYFYATAAFEYLEGLPFSVFDALGRLRMQAILYGENQAIDITPLEPGIYYIQFQVEEKVITKKISIL